jgi:hypothetical protein
MTQAQVASLLGVAYHTVVEWKHNVSGIGPRNSASIVAFMGYDPDRRNPESNTRPK